MVKSGKILYQAPIFNLNASGSERDLIQKLIVAIYGEDPLQWEFTLDNHYINWGDRCLQLTRCLGDRAFDQLLSRIPVIHTIRESEDLRIFLASDGIQVKGYTKADEAMNFFIGEMSSDIPLRNFVKKLKNIGLEDNLTLAILKQ